MNINKTLRRKYEKEGERVRYSGEGEGESERVIVKVVYINNVNSRVMLNYNWDIY